MTNTATQKQIDFINALQAERVWLELDFSEEAKLSTVAITARVSENPAAYTAGILVTNGRKKWRQGKFSAKAASVLIEGLQKCDRKPSDRTYPLVNVEAGRYALTVLEGAVNFYVVNKRGRVSVQASDELHRLRGEAASSVLEEISKDPKAASLLYGAKLGHCGVCGRTLTDEESRAAGIGPVCRAKKGW